LAARRANTGAASGFCRQHAGPFEESEVEITQTREEPVVGNASSPRRVCRAQGGAGPRREVRDTVRESRVEVDQAAAGDKPGGSDFEAS
jgi:hypothetical protein